MSVRMDGERKRTVSFDPTVMRHFDHGYAVTSTAPRGLLAERVLVNIDTEAHPQLINTRFAYVSYRELRTKPIFARTTRGP